jgi:hypothetical protein
MHRIAPGLFRWTAPHPDWRGDVPEDHPLDWPRDVGCVAAEVADALVLIDPLVPDELWPEIDSLVSGRPVAVLTTLPFHQRSAAEAIERYGASTDLPDGVQAIEVPHAAERVFWLPELLTLVPGDCLIARPRDAGLRLPPAPWLQFVPGGATVEQLAADLRPLLELPIERIMVAHGEPVLSGGREALARAVS